MPDDESFAEMLTKGLNRTVRLRELSGKLNALVWQERGGKKRLDQERELARQILQILDEWAKALEDRK